MPAARSMVRGPTGVAIAKRHSVPKAAQEHRSAFVSPRPFVHGRNGTPR